MPSSRAELAAFLRAQRSRLKPEDVGLDPPPGQRRTPGLRREEVAQISGIGLTWYTWLEQARDIPASARVIDALARAMRLTPDQYRHLRALADLSPIAPEPPSPEAIPRLQRLVDSIGPAPAAVYDVHYDYLVWNAAYARVRHDPATAPDDRRNLLWMLFAHEEIRARMPAWEPAARSVLGQFCAAAGERADDPRFAELIKALSDVSREFREWWADYPVRGFVPAIVPIEHPEAGRIRLELFQLRPLEHPDLILTMQVPVTQEDRERVEALQPAVRDE